MSTLVLASGGASHVGTVRSVNEDAWLAQRPVFLVADGMGGHDAGDVAAGLVVDAFRALSGDWVDPTRLDEVVREAGDAVRALARPGHAPGSTATGLVVTESDGRACWLVLNIGDSRTYRQDRHGFEQITVDHSDDEDRRAAGQEPVVGHSHIITRALGAGVPADVGPDYFLLLVAPGDRMLVCSDGLTGALPDERIAELLEPVEAPQEAAELLVAEAVAAGARDNVTAVVVDAVAVDPSPDEALHAPTDQGVDVGTGPVPGVAADDWLDAPTDENPEWLGTTEGPA